MLNNKSKTNPSVLLVILLFVGVVGGFAQSTTATLSGNVTDERDAVVSGATVRISNTETGFERTVATDENGSFSVPLLPPSTYLVTIERAGFAPFEVRDVVLNANDRRALNIRLKVGQVTGTVEVTDTPSLVDENPAVGTTIDRTFVENLPLNGRSIQTLINLSPGVVAVPVSQGGGNQGQFSVNGQRTNSNYVTVDGVSGNFSITNFESLGQNGSGSIPATNIQGGFSNLASVDALQEFTIQTSTFAPQFGRSPGGQISLVTRSGENKFHGSLFEYLRNDVFDSRDFFDAKKPALRFNNFGGTFSGPVVLPGFGEGTPLFHVLKDKTFFFLSYEGQRFLLPQPTTTATVPSLSARQNAPNDVARAILNAFPLPNGAEIRTSAGALTGGALYTTNFSNPNSSDTWGLRIDHNFNKNFTLFSRYNYAPSESNVRSASNPSAFTVNTQKTEKLTLGSNQVFGAKLVNEILVDFSRQEGLAESDFDGFGGGVLPPTSIFLPEGVGTQRRYSISTVPNVFGSFAYGDVVENENRQFQLVDNLSYNLGSHQLKFGGDYRRLTPTIGGSDLILTIIPGSLQNVYNNLAPTVIGTRSARFTALFKTFSFYGQDTWKANKRLTLTYGLRWEINPSPTNAGGDVPYTLTTPPDLNQLDQSGLALAPPGTPYFKTDNTNFAPRFGLAYQVSQKAGRELVVRGGIGMFYDLGQVGFGNAGFPYTRSLTLSNVPLPVPASSAVIPVRSLTLGPTNRASVTAAAPDYTLPVTYQWNLTAEQSLGKNQTLSVGYVGALGRKLARVRTVQIGLPGQFPNVYFSPNFSTVVVVDNGTKSNYHSMQAQFVRRLSQGLQVIASYTWSHSIDNGSNDSGITSPGFSFPQDVFHGDSDFDVRQNFSGALTYNIPAPKWNKVSDVILRNWSINSVFSARTGLPYTLTITEPNPLGGTPSIRRPNLTGAPIYIDDPTVATGRRLNPVAFNFALPSPQFGNLGRNALRGPGFWQVDLSVHRTFDLTEKLKLQFRVEAFNVFNHSNFLYPSDRDRTAIFFNGNVIFNPTFGVITQTAARGFGGGSNTGGFNPLFQVGGPRSMQFAFRLNF